MGSSPSTQRINPDALNRQHEVRAGQQSINNTAVHPESVIRTHGVHENVEVQQQLPTTDEVLYALTTEASLHQYLEDQAKQAVNASLEDAQLAEALQASLEITLAPQFVSGITLDHIPAAGRTATNLQSDRTDRADMKVETLLKSLKQMTECPICHECFVDPRSLPCLHTFCLQCLRAYGGSSGRQVAGSQLRCPMCRKEFSVPAGGWDKLPKDFHMEDLLTLYRSLSMTSSGAERKPAAAATQ